MTRTSKPPYCCPRCGYETSRKDLITRHFTTLKQACPALNGDIVIDDAIKDYVLANRIYRRPTVVTRPPPSTSIVHVDTTMKPQVPAVVLRVMAMCQYVYIIYVREFMMRNEPIYKLGKTTQENVRRASSYPKGSVLLLLTSCRDCTLAEQELMAVFKSKYQQATEYGLEYFKGDAKCMMHDMNAIVERLDQDAEPVEAPDASQ